MIVIVDYKTGNIGSIQNMLKKIGHPSIISNEVESIKAAKKLILPGVGSFDYGMRKLRELNLLDALNERVLTDKIPILGICLGAQLCCMSSEEGTEQGLGWVDATVKKFSTQKENKKYFVPHMGWDHVQPLKESKLFIELESEARFYFVHSYSIHCANQQDVLTRNSYSFTYDSAFEKGNIIGVQFHPEKSHKFGKHLLRNFIENY